jgi:hypothetical protein
MGTRRFNSSTMAARLESLAAVGRYTAIATAALHFERSDPVESATYRPLGLCLGYDRRAFRFGHRA